jgi:formimidoylglutamase
MNLFNKPNYSISRIDKNELTLKDVIAESKDKCDVSLAGIPFDGSTFGRPGARYAPKYIREHLLSLNTYSYEFDFDLSKLKILDFGDIKVSNTDFNFTFENIFKASKECMKNSKLSIYIGGDHSITYPLVKAYCENYGKLNLIILDAHHDIREINEPYSSSGTFLRRIIYEENKPSYIFQIGIRDFYNNYYYYKKAKDYGIEILTVDKIRKVGIKKILSMTFDAAKQSDVTYLSIDVDVLDMLYASGTNSPCINGLNSMEFLNIIKEICKIENLKAVDIVELAPLYDLNNYTTKLISYSIAYIIAAKFSNNQ